MADALVIVLVFALAALGVAGGLVLVRLIRGELAALRVDTSSLLSERSSEVDRRLHGMTQTVDRRLSELDTKVDRRLETATKTTNAIHERLGKVDQAAGQMISRANDLARLEQALRPPKARGGVGELLLGNLLRDVLPVDSYQLEYGFKTGVRVDAVIKVDKLVPVDAKFPLDNFERVVTAEDEASRTLHERAFARDVKTHVDAIATKYIRPAENTYEFALMYLPSESVYYELVAGSTGALYSYALEKRVFPVSPSTFHAYLLVITLGLRGMQIEQHAQEVMAYTAQLARDFDRFRTDFDVLGRHLGNARSKFDEADRRLERLGTRLERAAEWDTAVEDADEPLTGFPRALDAA